MAMKINNNFSSIEQITGTYLNNQVKKARSGESEGNVSFDKILKEKSEKIQLGELKFSKHAGLRLEERNISLTEEQLNRLKEATKKADEKGIKESLMIMDDMAFIVNVRNNTVITAMEQKDNGENVYTNIDGAVIA